MTQRHSFRKRLRAAPLFAGLALALGLDGAAQGASDPDPPAIVVDNCHDSGAGSLRAAVPVASEGETIGTDADIGAFERQGNGNGFVFAGDFENARCP